MKHVHLWGFLMAAFMGQPFYIYIISLGLIIMVQGIYLYLVNKKIVAKRGEVTAQHHKAGKWWGQDSNSGV